MLDVSDKYNVSSYEVSGKNHPLLLLKKSRTIKPSGDASHVYLPKELEGEDVIGVILR